MFTTNVPKHFWGEVVLIATYLINRMPSRVLKFQTPCQTLLLSYPDTRIISSLPLKVFGCTTFVHIHQRHQSKLDPKATKCLFLGYSPTKKGYKCYSPITRRFYTSMDVTFFENQSYYQKTHIQGENLQECNFWLDTSILPKTKSNAIIEPKNSIPLNTFIAPETEPNTISPETESNTITETILPNNPDPVTQVHTQPEIDNELRVYSRRERIAHFQTKTMNPIQVQTVQVTQFMKFKLVLLLIMILMLLLH